MKHILLTDHLLLTLDPVMPATVFRAKCEGLLKLFFLHLITHLFSWGPSMHAAINLGHTVACFLGGCQ